MNHMAVMKTDLADRLERKTALGVDVISTSDLLIKNSVHGGRVEREAPDLKVYSNLLFCTWV